jgi:hypothetical protein
MLPSVASINGMQVKEYIQALLDDSKVRMEKIGSVNWYWNFPSEEKREREKVKERLARDLERAQKTVEELEMELQEKVAATKGAGSDEDDAAAAEAEAEQRKSLMQRRDALIAEVKKIRADEEILMAGGAAGIRRKREVIETAKQEATIWTDNIYILEQYLTKLASGDRDLVDALKRECYGDQYEEGEGLRELDM